MASNHLTLRLTEQDTLLVDLLRAQTGLSKSDVVKHALRSLAGQVTMAAPAPPSLFDLGAHRFGKHGSAARQSAQIKAVVRGRVQAKAASRSRVEA